MAYCSNCGTYVNDNDRFCGNCGASVPGYDNVNQSGSTYIEQQPEKRKIDSGMLTFSILMAIFASRVLGVIAIVFTILASKENTDEGEKDKLKVAKILNIVALVVLILAILLVVAALAFSFTIGAGLLSEIFNEYSLSLII